MPTILRETYPTAKKEHRCEFCCEKIAIGQKYVRQTNVYDGTINRMVDRNSCSGNSVKPILINSDCLGRCEG